MGRVLPVTAVLDESAAYGWAETAARAAAQVPATGDEAVAWTLRGWAEIAFACILLDSPAATLGLDDVVRRSTTPCRGPFSRRLRALRGLVGEVPAWYFPDDAGEGCGGSTDADCESQPPTALRATVAPKPKDAPSDETVEAWRTIAAFCDALAVAISSPGGERTTGGRTCGRNNGGQVGAGRNIRGEEDPPLWAQTADHLRWGERFRPHIPAYPYEVLNAAIDGSLAWRSWMSLPTAGTPRTVLATMTAGSSTRPMRPRVCHGIHNGAHLDHLAALTAEAPLRGAPSPIEFGAGLLAAESYAMAVELLAAAECTVSGLTGEARQLRHGLVERIGRHPGYAHWCAGLGNGKRALTGGSDRSVTSPSGALAEAASTRVGEFGALPTLASNYVTGPLSLIGGGHGHPFVPGALLTRFQDRWCAVADRFPPAALLTRRARALT